ncbi:hypothetical protein NHP164001_17770 [Helicobacter trogontum]|uniref:Uncharacterized protein n=1 Tax=Helicobacter trogontum TaxID=50960 RepID=A0ABQ0D5Z6_9HELI
MTKKTLCQIHKGYVPDIDKYQLKSMSKKELKSRIKLMRFCLALLSKS